MAWKHLKQRCLAEDMLIDHEALKELDWTGWIILYISSPGFKISFSRFTALVLLGLYVFVLTNNRCNAHIKSIDNSLKI